MDIIRGVKIPLYPTKDQESLFKELADCYHNLGNKAVEFIKQGYTVESSLRPEMIKYVSNIKLPISFIITILAKEKLNTFYQHGKVNYHKYKESYKAFPVRCDASGKRDSRIYSDDLEYIKIPSVPGKVKISRNYLRKLRNRKGVDYVDSLLNAKKQTARVTWDGKYWFLVVTIIFSVDPIPLNNTSIGIDLGIKTLAVTSDNDSYQGVSKLPEVLRLEKKVRKLQSKLAIKYRLNNYRKTNNIKRLENEIYLCQLRIKNIRENRLHNISKAIVSKRHSAIYLEDLNIKGMLKNRRLAKAISSQGWYKLGVFISYKAELWGENVVKVPRLYPSSKRCSNCGNINHNLILSDRIYICPVCGLKIDRDYNAAINIRNYGLAI